MENRPDDLWQGGQWEQPSPTFPTPPPVHIPTGRKQTKPMVRMRTKKRSKWKGFLILLLIVAALTGGAVLLNGVFAEYFPVSGPYGFGDDNRGNDYWDYEQEQTSTDPPTIPKADTGTGVTVGLVPYQGESLSWTQVYNRAAQSIVSIEAKSGDTYGTGTGVILTGDGYILTNAHVVSGAESVSVVFGDNTALEAQLVGFDADEDLSVLKVDTQGLIPAEFGDSDLLLIGEPVAAIGDPLGYRSTITDGIVSSLNRDVTVDGVTMTLIQTSAAINFGNSGGALLNAYGQVVGITTIKIVTYDGSAEALGFAIPSARVKYVADRLIAGEEIRTGSFGITVDTRRVEGGGIQILAVDGDSDAAAQGVLAGDIIVEVDGMPIGSIEDLSASKRNRDVGDSMLLTIRRGEELLGIVIQLVEIK